VAVRIAWLIVVVSGCRPDSPMPPIPAPVINTGDPALETMELSISERDRNPLLIQQPAGARFNVSWFGPKQVEPPAEPHAFLVKIGRKRPDGVLLEDRSVLVLQPIETVGEQSRYRVAMSAPDTPGTYALQLWTPGKVVLDIELIVDVPDDTAKSEHSPVHTP
jgi:hypothetical protein